MSPKIAEITERTVIPLSLVFILAGAVVYIVSDHALGQANLHDLHVVQKKQDEYQASLEKIDSRLSHIEGALNIRGVNE